MKTRTLTISVLLLAILLAPLAMAGEFEGRGPRGRGERPRRGPGGPGGFHGGIGRMLLGRAGERIGLTDEQREEIEAILGRGIVFAIVITMVTANLRSGIIDAATAIFTQVSATGVDQQEPTVFILVNLDIFMGKLPE